RVALESSTISMRMRRSLVESSQRKCRCLPGFCSTSREAFALRSRRQKVAFGIGPTPAVTGAALMPTWARSRECAYIAANVPTIAGRLLLRLSNPTVRVVALLLLCVASLTWTKLSPAAGFLVLLVWLAMPKIADIKRRRALNAGLIAATLMSAAGFVRFVLDEAIPG